METPHTRDALAVALKKLRTKDQFEDEIRRFLSDFDAKTIEVVIGFLKERRIIDDSKTITNLIERQSGKRLVGKEKLRADLLQRGAPEEMVDAVLGEQVASESQRALELLAAKFTPMDPRARVARFLYSRGFSEEDIEGALDCFFR